MKASKPNGLRFCSQAAPKKAARLTHGSKAFGKSQPLAAQPWWKVRCGQIMFFSSCLTLQRFCFDRCTQGWCSIASSALAWGEELGEGQEVCPDLSCSAGRREGLPVRSEKASLEFSEVLRDHGSGLWPLGRPMLSLGNPGIISGLCKLWN